MDPVLVGERLRRLRVERNKKPEEVAVACDNSASAISMYETGKRIPRDDVKMKLADYYGLSVGDIFYCA
jgi:transcriptional regulator with XRE-family HTH domain